MHDLSLRGRCQDLAEFACASDPSLRPVRGYYYDPTWGKQEHWWAERPDGSIVDPSSAQFPMGGVADWYEEFDGVFECEQCGADVAEADAVHAGNFIVCSDRCYGRLVGM